MTEQIVVDETIPPTPPAVDPVPTPPPTDPIPAEPIEPVPTNVPATAGEYEINVDGFDVDAFKTENAAVLDRFHAVGLDNDQVSEVVKIWDEFQQTNIESLQTEWGNDFAVNVGFAQNAIKALGFKPEELDSPTALIRFASAVGKTLQEDLPPSNTQQSNSESVEQLMMSEAYSNANHPDHASVASKVSAYFQKNTPE